MKNTAMHTPATSRFGASPSPAMAPSPSAYVTYDAISGRRGAGRVPTTTAATVAATPPTAIR